MQEEDPTVPTNAADETESVNQQQAGSVQGHKIGETDPFVDPSSPGVPVEPGQGPDQNVDQQDVDPNTEPPQE